MHSPRTKSAVLFADYVNLYLELKGQHMEVQPPLLLSCSEGLRRRARETVANLIKCNPRWRQGDDGPPETPGECFQEFQSFLRNLVPEDEREERFGHTRYIGYGRFRRMWQAQFKKKSMRKNIGPDLSWHVIRTYIKGTNSQEYLDPDEYEHVARRQKSVRQETFSTVFNAVWEGWYRQICEGQGYWDDQDLARYVFEAGYARSDYPAVFCDEAQDFTRVELDLLFSLSLFADRKLRQWGSGGGGAAPRVAMEPAGATLPGIRTWERLSCSALLSAFFPSRQTATFSFAPARGASSRSSR